MKPSRSTNDYLRLFLSQHTQLFFLGHSSNDAGNLDLFSWVFAFVDCCQGHRDVALYLLGQLMGGCQDQPQNTLRNAGHPNELPHPFQFREDGSCKGEGLSRSGLGSDKEVVVVRVVVKDFLLDSCRLKEVIRGECVHNRGLQALKIIPLGHCCYLISNIATHK